MNLTVEDSSDVVMVADAPLSHRCPHRDERDEGRVRITWRILGRTIELHALRGYLDAFSASRLSHEEITDAIRNDLSCLPEVELIAVETTWTTAGMEVRCSTSPTPAGTL